MAVPLTLNCLVTRTREQVSCDVGGEAAVLNLANGAYYGLDAVGARIWNLLAVPRTVSQLRDTLLKEYEVAAEPCERDLWRFLSELAGEGLIEVRQGPVEGCEGRPESGGAVVTGQTELNP